MQFIVHFGKRKPPTNGEIIKALFSCKERRSNGLIFSNLNDLTIFSEDWWDAPYETVTKFADRCRESGREKVLDKIRAEIEELPKTYPFVNHCDMYVKEDDVKKIIDKYKAESEDKE